MNNRALFYILGLILAIFVYVFSPIYFYNNGIKCLKNKNYSCAVNNLGQSYHLRPKNLDYKYYYTKALINSKPTYNIQKIMYEISKDKNKDSASALALKQIKILKSQILKQTGNNYIQQVPMDTNVIRWNKKSFPLSVYIEIGDDIPKYYEENIIKALRFWEKSVNFISFSLQKEFNNPKILIEVKTLQSPICNNDQTQCKYIIGFTTPDIKGNTLKKMHIILYDKDLTGMYFSDKEIFNTVLHELGHALGIMGHSYNSSDLMYSTKKQDDIYTSYKDYFHSLSNADINTIKLLYRLEPTMTDIPAEKNNLIYSPIILGEKKDIASKKLEEAQDYIKSSPNVAAGYIDLAGAYLELDNFEKTISSLKKGLQFASSNEEKYIIYYNLAYVYYRYKRFETALNYVNKAKTIKDSEELNDIEIKIKSYMK